MRKDKIVVILGPTATGKTRLGVKMAGLFNGEIVSADSRQVYRTMNIGTGKDLSEYTTRSAGGYCSIPYHMIDVSNPDELFNLAIYQKQAIAAINEIIKRGKLPILVGGTGLYIQALVDGYTLSEVEPNHKLRGNLEKMNSINLFNLLVQTNPEIGNNLNESDKKNKRRLIRYIELGNDKKLNNAKQDKSPRYEALIIGMKFEREVINKRIKKRLTERLEKEDMVDEVLQLHKQLKSWTKVELFGLEYKYIAFFLQNKINYDEMKELLLIAIRQYAKKQMTWFRRWEKQGAKIEWLGEPKEAGLLVSKFIAN